MSKDIICNCCGAVAKHEMTREGVPIWEFRERFKTYCPNGCAYGLSDGCYGVADDRFLDNSAIVKAERTKNNIKACPHCGGVAKSSYAGAKLMVFCTDCRIQTQAYETLAEAVAVWNGNNS